MMFVMLLATSVWCDMQMAEYRNTFFHNSYGSHYNSLQQPATPLPSSNHQPAAAYYPFTFFSRQSPQENQVERNEPVRPINSWYNRPSSSSYVSPIVYQYQTLGHSRPTIYKEPEANLPVGNDVIVADILVETPIELKIFENEEGSGVADVDLTTAETADVTITTDVAILEADGLISRSEEMTSSPVPPGTVGTEASVTSSDVEENRTEINEFRDNDKVVEDDVATPPPTTPATNEEEKSLSPVVVTTPVDPLTTTNQEAIIAVEERKSDDTTTSAPVARLPLLPIYLRQPHALGLQYDPPRYFPTLAPPRHSGYIRHWEPGTSQGSYFYRSSSNSYY